MLIIENTCNVLELAGDCTTVRIQKLNGSSTIGKWYYDHVLDAVNELEESGCRTLAVWRSEDGRCMWTRPAAGKDCRELLDWSDELEQQYIKLGKLVFR